MSKIGSFENVSSFSKRSADLSKILILGTSNSGKSTLYRQMQIINTAGFSEEERKAYKKIITDNVVDCILLLLNKWKNSQIPQNPEVADLILEFRDLSSGHRWDLSKGEETKLLQLSQQLWDLQVIKEIFESHRSEMECPDSVTYLLNTINDVVEEDSLPSNQQILRSRLTTTGVRSLNFTYENTIVQIIDVGGQRSERRKWIHYFDDIEVLLFCVSVNEYDMTLREDPSTSSMAESLEIFESVINSDWFKSKQVVVFLNKIDLFEEKLMNSNIEEYHPDFVGNPRSYDDVIGFIKKKYLDCDKQADRSVFFFTTCATDTDSISKVSRVCFDSVLSRHLSQIGLG